MNESLAEHLAEIDFPAAKLTELKELNEQVNDLEILLRCDHMSSVCPDLEVELTSCCNFDCIICGRSYIEFPRTWLTVHKLIHLYAILPYVKKAIVAGVGEPTLSSLLDQLSKMLESFGCNCRIFTNGALIDSQLDVLARFDDVSISFDGASKRTFEAQRRGANFSQILNSVTRLRGHAKRSQISFSVVVSRLNVGEVAHIVQLGGDLKIDRIHLSPVEHTPPLALKASDWRLYRSQIRKARKIARRHRIELSNNLRRSSFLREGDTPRDEKALRAHYAQLARPRGVATSASAETRDSALSPIPVIDLDLAIEKLRKERDLLRVRILSVDHRELAIPYCLAIWRYLFAKSDGGIRLCPQRDVDMGHNPRRGYLAAINSDGIRRYRRSLYKRETMPPDCIGCNDPHRQQGRMRLLKACLDLGIKPKDRSVEVL